MTSRQLMKSRSLHYVHALIDPEKKDEAVALHDRFLKDASSQLLIQRIFDDIESDKTKAPEEKKSTTQKIKNFFRRPESTSEIIKKIPQPFLDACVVETGHTMLTAATLHGRTDIVRALLDAKATVNIMTRDRDHSTPLAIAILTKHTTIFSHLLAAKADPNLYPEKGATPIELAIDLDNAAPTRLFIQSEISSNPATLFEVLKSRKPSPDVMHYLTELGKHQGTNIYARRAIIAYIRTIEVAYTLNNVLLLPNLLVKDLIIMIAQYDDPFAQFEKSDSGLAANTAEDQDKSFSMRAAQ